jgi:hypothetical protein
MSGSGDSAPQGLACIILAGGLAERNKDRNISIDRVQAAPKLGQLQISETPASTADRWCSPKEGDVRVVYGTLQVKEQEMAAKEDLEAMEEMTTVGQQPHNN